MSSYMHYPVTLALDSNATWMVTFPDFPEAVTFGNTEAEALHQAIDALEEVISTYMTAKKPIPTPSSIPSAPRVQIDPLVESKILLYMAMLEANVSKAELARRLHCKFPQVDRLLKLKHSTQFHTIVEAFAVLGKNLVIGVENK